MPHTGTSVQTETQWWGREGGDCWEGEKFLGADGVVAAQTERDLPRRTVLLRTADVAELWSICVTALGLGRLRLLAIPGTVARQAPLSMGSSRQEYGSGLPCPPPGDLPNLEIEPWCPALQVDCLPSEPLGKPFSSRED